MAIDPTIALQQAPQFNPVDTMGKVLQMGNMQNQNTLGNLGIQQQTLSLTNQKNLNDAIQSSIDPTTGMPDYAKVSQMLAQSGSGSVIPGVMKTNFEMQQEQGKARQLQLQNAAATASAVGQRLGPLAANTNLTRADLVNTSQQALRDGLLDPAHYQQSMQEIQSLPEDPKVLQQYAQAKLMQNRSVQDQIGLLTPKTTAQTVGSNIVPTTITQGTGQVTVGTPFATGPASEIAKELQDFNASRTGANQPPVGINDPSFLAWHQKMHPNMATMMTGGSGGLTPDALNLLAQQGITTGQVPKLGSGFTGTASQVQIANAMAKQSQQQGGSNLAGNQASFKSDQASLTQMQKQHDAVVSFENTALKNLNVFEGLAKNMVDTNSPLLNQPVRWLASQAAGSPGQAAANAALQTVLPEYAKINSGSMGNQAVSDSSRHEIAAILGKDATLGQILAIGGVLHQDAENRRTSLEDGISSIKARFSGTPPPGQPQSQQQPQPQVQVPTITNQADYAKLPVGASYLDATGAPHRKGGGQ